jgi:hypothetical protein
VVDVLVVARRAVEVDGGIDLAQLGAKADLIQRLLDDRLLLLAHRVDRGDEGDAQLDAVLGTDVALHRPTGLLQDPLRFLDVELPGGVGRLHCRDTGQDVGSRRLELLAGVELLGDDVALHGEVERLADGFVAHCRVNGAELGPFPVDLSVWIGKLDHQALDRIAAGDEDEPFAALLQLV